MMSYSIPNPSQEPASPLTTLFNPPSDCEIRPEVWTLCIESVCYWAQPRSCYPPGGRTTTNVIQSYEYTETLQYSPGVLPLSYTTVNVVTAQEKDETAAIGCFRGFTSASDPYYMCSSAATGGTYVVDLTTTTGDFDVYLPRVVVVWAASDLGSFHPASAPILGNHASARPPSTAASTPASAPATSTSQSPSTGTFAGTAGVNASSSQSGNMGLSTGAEAGIGVGVAVAVLALIGLAIWLFRRSRRRTSEFQGQRIGHLGDQPPYLDSKAELSGMPRGRNVGSHARRSREPDPPEKPAVELQGAGITKPKERDVHELPAQQERQEIASMRETYEMPGDREAQEIGTARGAQETGGPPPVPLASKPRYNP